MIQVMLNLRNRLLVALLHAVNNSCGLAHKRSIMSDTCMCTHYGTSNSAAANKRHDMAFIAWSQYAHVSLCASYATWCTP
jgi:hypothetical protein